MYKKLNPDKALIFRIVHIQNVPWLLDNGMHCMNSEIQASDYKAIGNLDLIAKRAAHAIPVPPGGTLGDYVPFYFTPFSPMLYNINTGYGGIAKVPNKDIVIFATSLSRLEKIKKTMCFRIGMLILRLLSSTMIAVV